MWTSIADCSVVFLCTCFPSITTCGEFYFANFGGSCGEHAWQKREEKVTAVSRDRVQNFVEKWNYEMKRLIALQFCLISCLCGKTLGHSNKNFRSHSARTLLALARTRSHSLVLCSRSARTLLALARTLLALARALLALARALLALCSHSARTLLALARAPLIAENLEHFKFSCHVTWGWVLDKFLQNKPRTGKMAPKIGLLRVWFVPWHFSSESRSNPAWLLKFNLQIAELIVFQCSAWIRIFRGTKAQTIFEPSNWRGCGGVFQNLVWQIQDTGRWFLQPKIPAFLCEVSNFELAWQLTDLQVIVTTSWCNVLHKPSLLSKSSTEKNA